MDEITAFLQRWDAWVYPGLALYAAVKSGLLPVFAAALAATGALDITLVVGSLLAGTWAGEEAKFHLARRFGPWMRARWPWLERSEPRLALLLARWGSAWMLLYRWPKGGRTLGAIPAGLAGWSWSRFAPLNLAGAIFWALPLCALGWFAGEGILLAIRSYGGLVTFVLLCLTVALVGYGWWRTSRWIAARAEA